MTKARRGNPLGNFLRNDGTCDRRAHTQEPPSPVSTSCSTGSAGPPLKSDGKCGLAMTNGIASQDAHPRVVEQAEMTLSDWRSRRDHLEADLPSGDFRFIALDVETACSDAASICQIGIACVRPDSRIETYAMLVNPRMRFSAFNVQLHGIGPDHVADAPDFGVAFARLAPLLSRHHLIQHSGFDKRALLAACAAATLDAMDWQWGDSVKIARRAWPEFIGNGGHGLGHLKKQLGLSFEHHDAGEDAKAAAMIVLSAEDRLGLSFDKILAARPSKKLTI